MSWQLAYICDRSQLNGLPPSFSRVGVESTVDSDYRRTIKSISVPATVRIDCVCIASALTGRLWSAKTSILCVRKKYTQQRERWVVISFFDGRPPRTMLNVGWAARLTITAAYYRAIQQASHIYRTPGTKHQVIGYEDMST